MKKHGRFHLPYAALAACTLLILLFCTACSGAGGNILGTWELESVQGSGGGGSDLVSSLQSLHSFGGSAAMTFGDNGAGTLSMNVLGIDQSSDFEYRVQGGRLILEGGEVSFRVSGNTLTLSGDGATLKLVRR